MSLLGVILVRISRILTEYGEILRICPYSVWMRENADQNNSEYRQFLRNDEDFFILFQTFLNIMLKLFL